MQCKGQQQSQYKEEIKNKNNKKKKLKKDNKNKKNSGTPFIVINRAMTYAFFLLECV